MNRFAKQLGAFLVAAITLFAAAAHAECAYEFQLSERGAEAGPAARIWCAELPASAQPQSSRLTEIAINQRPEVESLMQLRARYKRRESLQDKGVLLVVLGGVATIGGILGIIFSSPSPYFRVEADRRGIGLGGGVLAAGAATLAFGAVIINQSTHELTGWKPNTQGPPPLLGVHF